MATTSAPVAIIMGSQSDWPVMQEAARMLEAMGVDRAKGVLRLSLVHYTSPQDVARLIAALDRAL